MRIHVLLAFLATTSSLVYSIPHCPGGQPAPKVTVTTTTTTTTTATTSITTTVHHTLTVTHHITSSFFSFSTQVSKHNKPNQPTASSFTVTTTAPAPTSSQTNLPPPKGGSLVNFSSLSDFPGPKSTPTSDCDISVDSDNGRPSDSNDIDGSEIGPHIQNGSDVSSGSSHNNISYSNPTRYDNDNSTLLNGNSSRHPGPVENSNSNDSDIQNEKSHGTGPSDDISRPPMKLCCNSQGQADSLVITLMAHSLGLDLSNKTGIIGVGCTVIGEGSLRDAPEWLCSPHSLIECGSFSPSESVGSRCSV